MGGGTQHSIPGVKTLPRALGEVLPPRGMRGVYNLLTPRLGGLLTNFRRGIGVEGWTASRRSPKTSIRLCRRWRGVASVRHGDLVSLKPCLRIEQNVNDVCFIRLPF
jgi:hypothetical protein